LQKQSYQERKNIQEYYRSAITILKDFCIVQNPPRIHLDETTRA